MNERGTAQSLKANVTKFTSGHANLLKRQCACGQHTIAGEECAECRQKHEGTIQRAAVSASPVNAVPPIVHNVLNSPGQPLDTETRALMEPRFGHDFSKVRIHTDERAVQSAQTVNALAYTVGRDVVFGQGQYAPGTSEGKGLLAHELTHVVQQRSMSRGGPLTVGPAGESDEQEADAAYRSASNIVQPSTQPIRLQRAIGDGHDLTSPRFAGNLVLEACYDDERYLMVGDRGTVGDRGPAV